MRLTVTSSDVKVKLSLYALDDPRCSLEYIHTGDDEPYTLSAEAKSAEALSRLLACAEGDSDTAMRVLNVLARAESLMADWRATEVK